ncbi:type I secretion protein [Agarivorans sp. OAG1]|uniref:T1SS-143 repeat domain-containing protein n=1 Tax=Agarivorans sp. OAG1 TaxID=3082387 RepID=UPI002B2C45F2|nr:type I secretion protein [Agarivorans sp. OAG1]
MKPVVYVDIEGQIWKVMGDGRWLKVEPTEIIDSSIPLVKNLVSDAEQTIADSELDSTETNNSQQDSPPLYSGNTSPLSGEQGSQGASFIVRVQPTLDETLPEAGFNTQATEKAVTNTNQQGAQADQIPPLSNQAQLTVNIVDGGDGYENQFEVPAVLITGEAPDVEDGRIVVITLTDSAGQTLTVEAVVSNNSYSYQDLDIQSLNEGPIDVYASVTDYFGQFVDANDSSIKDVTAVIEAEIDGQGDSYVNQYEQAITPLYGNIIGIEDNQVVLVQVVDESGQQLNFTSQVLNNSWNIASADLTALQDGVLTINVSAVDIAGNPASASSTIIKDTLASLTADIDGVNDNYINAIESPSTLLYGQVAAVEDGQIVSVTVTDNKGEQLSFQTTVSNNSWQISNVDLTPLAEGSLTITANTSDIAGNLASASSSIVKDTFANISANFDGQGDNYVNAVEVPATRLFGEITDVEDGQLVNIQITDINGASLNLQTTIANGQWLIPSSNLSNLADGELNLTASTSDIAGNSVFATTSIIKDTQASISARFEGNGDNALNQAEVGQSLLEGELVDVEDGQPVNITVTDSLGTSLQFTTTSLNNHWQVVENLSGLADGELQLTVTSNDIAGNPASVTNVITLDSSIPTIDIDTLDGFSISQFKAGVLTSLQGTTSGVEPGQQVSITITDGPRTVIALATVDQNGDWLTNNIDTSELNKLANWILTTEVSDVAGNSTQDALPLLAEPDPHNLLETDLYQAGVLVTNSNVNIFDAQEITFSELQPELVSIQSGGSNLTIFNSADNKVLEGRTTDTNELVFRFSVLADNSIQTLIYKALDNTLDTDETFLTPVISATQYDADGTSETVLTPLVILVKDSVPQLFNDYAQVTEGDSVFGNVIANDYSLDGELKVNQVTVDGVTKDVGIVPAVFITEQGYLLVDDSGYWLFVANRNLDHQQAQELRFDYQAIDSSGDTASAHNNIVISDGSQGSFVNDFKYNTEGSLSDSPNVFTESFTIKPGSDNPDPDSVKFSETTLVDLESLALTSGNSLIDLSYSLSDDGKTISAEVPYIGLVFTLSLSANANGNEVNGTTTLTMFDSINQFSSSDLSFIKLTILSSDLDGTANEPGLIDWVLADGNDPQLTNNESLNLNEAELNLGTVTASGSIDLTIGSDAIDEFFFDNQQTAMTSGGESLSFAVSPSGNTLTAYTDNVNDPVFTIVIDDLTDAHQSQTLSYEFSLYKGLDQNNGSHFPIKINVRDSDNDTQSLALDITVTDSDDIAVTVGDLQVSETPRDPDTALTINSTATTTVSITANQDPIEKLFLDITNGSPVLDSLGNTISQNGQALSWQDNANGTYDAVYGNTVVFSLSLPDDFELAANSSIDVELTFNLYSAIDHLDSSQDHALSLSLPITATDTDGTSIAASSIVTIYDGRDPKIETAGQIDVNESDLANGNIASGISTVSPTIKVSAGSDEITDILLDTAAFNALGIQSGGSPVNLAAANNDGWYIATNDLAEPIFQIKINTDGSTEFELYAALDHPDGNGENLLALDFVATAIDADNDVSASTNFSVSVTDDTPQSENRSLDLVEGESFSTQLLNETVSGSDGASIVSFNYMGTNYAIAANSSVTIDLLNPNLLSEVYGELTLHANGELVLTTESNVTESPALLDSISYIVEDNDGDQVTSTATLNLGDSPGVIRTENAETTEDNSVTLSIEVRPGDTDQNEAVSNIIIDETSLNGGSLFLGNTLLVASGGLITITDLQFNGNVAKPNGVLSYQPAENESNTTSSVSLAISSTISTLSGDRVISSNLEVSVLPVADTPTWSGSSQYTYNMVEDDDSNQTLDITANLVDSIDGSETLSYQFADLPDGLQLSLNGNPVTEGKSYNQNQLDQITVKADNNLAGQFTFTLIAIATEAGNAFAAASDQTAQTSQTVTINVQPEADLPSLSVRNIKGLEDQAINLSDVIAGQLNDTDGSETLSYKIVVQDGWQVSGGSTVLSSPNTYLVQANELDAGIVSLIPKPDISSFTESLTLSVTAIASESTIDGLVPSPVTAESSAQIITVSLTGVVDTPTVADAGAGNWAIDQANNVISNQASFNEDQLFALDFEFSTSDDDASESINLLITNLPDNIRLVDSLGNPYSLEVVGKDPVTGAIYQVNNSILSQLFVKTDDDFSGELSFDIKAISTEPDGDSGEFEYTVNIEVSPVVDENDGASLFTQAVEDRNVSLNLMPPLSADSDGSETITAYTITSLPSDLHLFINGVPALIPPGGLDLSTLFDPNTTNLANFLSSGQLTIRANADLSGDFTIPISYQIVDTSPTGATDTKNLTANLQIDVAGRVELDTRLEAITSPLESNDGSAISLDGSVLFVDSDLDGSEYLDYIEIVIPEGEFFQVEHPNGAIMGANNNWIIPANGLTSDSVAETAADILAGASLYSALNTDQVTITIRARVIDDEDARYISAPLQVQVSGHSGGDTVPCTPSAPGDLSNSIVDANEGQDIDVSGHLNGDIANDPSDVISFYISVDDLPEGVELEGAEIYPEYNALGNVTGYTISASAIETMTITGLDEDYAGQLDIPVTVIVTDTCTGDSISEQQTISILVQPIVDDISLTISNNVIQEDTSTNLNMAFVLGDSNIPGEGIETVNSLIFTVPANSSFIGDSAIITNNGDDTWTVIDPSRLNEIEFRPPNNFSGQLTIDVAANITDSADGLLDTQTKNTSLTIEVQPVADLVLLAAINSSGDEDNYIQLDGLAAHQIDLDGSETTSLSIHGVPEGAVLSYFDGSNYQLLQNNGADGGSFNGAPTHAWGLDISQLSEIYILPPLDFSGDIPLIFEAISLETANNDFKVSTQDFVVGVNPVGDDSQFFEVPESLSSDEGIAIDIPLNISSFETDSNEQILVGLEVNNSSDASALTGLDRIVINGQQAHFVYNGSGYIASLLINAASVTSLQLYAGDAFGQLDVTLFSQTKDSAFVLGSEVSDLGDVTTENLTINISPLPDPPIVELQYSHIYAEQSGDIPLGISMDLINPAAGEEGKITISGIPDGIEIAGQAGNNGQLEFMMNEVADLAITGGQNSATNFTLLIDSSATLDDNKAEGISQELEISLSPVGDNTLDGGIQQDLIIGGAGNDLLSGGLNNDVFAFRTEDLGSTGNPNLDTISDFNAAEKADAIDLSSILHGLGVNNGSSAETYIQLSEQSGSTLLEIKPDTTNVTQSIQLSGVSLDELYKGDASLADQSDLLQKMIDDQNLIVS